MLIDPLARALDLLDFQGETRMMGFLALVLGILSWPTG
jgi:hypothetical protein